MFFNIDLSKKITVEVRGEILELKDTINTMVDQLNSFASEVTRVAREVGSDGKLGGQADVKGVGGTWKDLTDNVNELAATSLREICTALRIPPAQIFALDQPLGSMQAAAAGANPYHGDGIRNTVYKPIWVTMLGSGKQ